MEHHEYANLFPMMNKDELSQLCQDIQTNGYDKTVPIILFEGKILDGRNRQLACDTVGVVAEYAEYKGDDPQAFVIRHNLHRRHLNESQRAVVASKLANMKQGERTDIQHSANLQKVISQPEAAAMLNVSPRTVATVKAIEKDAPEYIPRIESGEMTAGEAMKKIKEQDRLEARAVIAEAGTKVPEADKWHVYHGNISTWQAPRQYDFIITDPPYPKEYLPLWGVLAQRSLEWLKPGGLLIAMSGQSYLNQVYSLLSKHLTYYWTASYLTPGQPTPLRQVNVNSTWKPLLMFTAGEYNGKIFGDVFKSDGNDKDFHKWGQSISGMFDIVSNICFSGQYILDPFCGAGTTGIAALMHECLFDGLEIEIENVNIARSRLNDTKETR